MVRQARSLYREGCEAARWSKRFPRETSHRKGVRPAPTRVGSDNLGGGGIPVGVTKQHISQTVSVFQLRLGRKSAFVFICYPPWWLAASVCPGYLSSLAMRTQKEARVFFTKLVRWFFCYQ